MGITPDPERYARLGVGLVIAGAFLAALGIGLYTGLQQELGGLTLLFFGLLVSFVFTMLLVLPSSFDFLLRHLDEDRGGGQDAD